MPARTPNKRSSIYLGKDGWCQPNGRPIGVHADWDEWNALLKTTAIRLWGSITGSGLGGLPGWDHR